MVLLRFLVALLLAPSLLLAQPAVPAPPANPLLVNHKNWFVPAQVWDIQKDPSLAKYRPANLTYAAYSAVGFSLANTIAIVGPTKEIVIIDTLETKENVQDAIKAPVYGFYAGNDARIGATVPKTQELMKAAGKTYDVVTYEGAGHGFMRAGDAPPPPPDADEKTKEAYAGNKKARDAAWARWLVKLRV